MDHLAAHEEFTAKVAAFGPVLQRDGGEAAALEASRFLRGWILRHIVLVDRLAFAGKRRQAAPATDQSGPATASESPASLAAAADAALAGVDPK